MDGLPGKNESHSRLVRLLLADRVVVHAELDSRTLADELPVAFAPDHGFEARRIKVHIARRCLRSVFTGSHHSDCPVMYHRAIPGPDFDGLYPGVRWKRIALCRKRYPWDRPVCRDRV